MLSIPELLKGKMKGQGGGGVSFGPEACAVILLYVLLWLLAPFVILLLLVNSISKIRDKNDKTKEMRFWKLRTTARYALLYVSTTMLLSTALGFYYALSSKSDLYSEFARLVLYQAQNWLPITMVISYLIVCIFSRKNIFFLPKK